MSLSSKILAICGAILVIGLLGFIVYQRHQISSRQSAIESQIVAQKELLDGIVRSQSTWATRDDVNKLITANGLNLKTIQDDLENLHAEISAVNIAVSSSSAQHGTNVPTKPGPNTNPNPINPNNPDPFGYMKNQQQLTLEENFLNVKVPIGTVGFSAWQKEPWNYDIKAREYHAATVIGKDENQRDYVYNKLTVKVEGKDYTLPIKTATTTQVYPEAKFSFWNPKLHLSAGGGVNLTQAPLSGSANIGVTLGIMSYGKYKTNPDISILQVGAAYQTGTNRPSVVVNPISFNVGGILPKGLVNNTYVGPSVQVDTAGNVITGANVSVAF